MNNIKKLRLKRKITQVDLATQIEVKQETISAYESGKTAVPTLFMIEIAKITNKSLNWFLNKI